MLAALGVLCIILLIWLLHEMDKRHAFERALHEIYDGIDDRMRCAVDNELGYSLRQVIPVAFDGLPPLPLAQRIPGTRSFIETPKDGIAADITERWDLFPNGSIWLIRMSRNKNGPAGAWQEKHGTRAALEKAVKSFVLTEIFLA